MKKNLLLLFPLFLFIIGCAEKPKSVGNGLPNIDGIFNILDTTLISTGDTTYITTFARGTGLSDLVGKISPTEEAVSLVNFIPGGTIDSLKGATIDTVEMRMTVNYVYKPSTFPVVLNVVEVKSSWSQATFNSDSLPSLMLDTKTIGTFSDSMNYSNVTIARLDTATVRKWATSYSDTNAPRFYGFAIQSPAGISNGIIGFSSFSDYISYVPILLIHYTKNGVRDSLSYYSGEDTYATKYSGPTIFSPITVQGAFGIRSKVFFDLNSFVNKPIINNATMELTLDTTVSLFGGYSPDSVTALLGMSSTIVDQADSTIYVYGYKTTTTAGQSPVYSFSITLIADRWVRSVKPNYGLSLRWAAEFGTVEKAVFFSSTAADITKRPRLKITYSSK